MAQSIKSMIIAANFDNLYFYRTAMEHIIKYLTKIAQTEFFEYTEKDNSCYHKDLCLIPEDVIGFIEETQGEKMVELYKQYGSKTHEKFLEHVAAEVKKKKTLEVFREGVKDRGQKLNMVYFKPSHSVL